MSMPLPPLNLASSSSSSAGLQSGDSFNFAPPQAKTSTTVIYAAAGVAVLAIAAFYFRGR